MTHSQNVPKLCDKLVQFANNHGVENATAIEQASKLLLLWARFLQANHLTGQADELLVAVNSAIRETAACTALGLIRPALFTMRGQVDLVISWLYFKDHPREYDLLIRTGDEYKLKTEILKYAEKHFDGFANRFGILKQVKTRKEEDPYRLLSAHAHSQHANVVPDFEMLEDVVQDRFSTECIEIQFEVAEYLSDLLFAIYGANYHALPVEIKRQIDERLKSPEQSASLYGTALR